MSTETTTLRDRLELALVQLSPELTQAGINGHCDAFALALMDYLVASGEKADDVSLLIISRERWDDNGEVIDSNPFSHVVVMALGTSWDVQGEDAEERWAADWIQPDDGEGDDEFDYNDISQEDLIGLRRARDRRDPSPEFLATYRDWLVATLSPVGPGVVKRSESLADAGNPPPIVRKSTM